MAGAGTQEEDCREAGVWQPSEPGLQLHSTQNSEFRHVVELYAQTQEVAR